MISRYRRLCSFPFSTHLQLRLSVYGVQISVVVHLNSLILLPDSIRKDYYTYFIYINL